MTKPFKGVINLDVRDSTPDHVALGRKFSKKSNKELRDLGLVVDASPS